MDSREMLFDFTLTKRFVAIALTVGGVIAPGVSVVFAATPTLVQWEHQPLNTQAGTTYYQTSLPNGSPGGNLIVLACQWGDSTQTPTISDDKSETWSTAKVVHDGTNGASAGIFYVANATSGVRAIKASFTSVGYTQCDATEVMNVATSSPVDVTAGQADSSQGKSHPAGNATTTSAGDFIFYYSVVDNPGTQSVANVWTAGTGFNLLSADGWSMTETQYEVQNASGTFNASATTTENVGAINVAIAFKASSAGNALPVGIEVQGVEVIEMASTGEFVTTNHQNQKFQAPTVSSGNGDMLAIIWGDGAQKVTLVTSTPAMTWASSTCNPLVGTSETEGINYVASATKSSTTTINLHYAATPNVAIVSVYDIIGADSSPYDTCATQTGTLNATQGTVTGPSVAPSTANGLIIGTNQESGDTTESVSVGSYVAAYTDVYQNTTLDQDGGYMLYLNPNTSTVSVNWTFVNTEGATNVGDWESIAAAFKAAQNTATISCAVSTSTTNFGVLSASAVTTSTPNVSSSMSCSGGAGLGCTLYIQDGGSGSQPGLYMSSGTTALIPSPDAAFDATTTLVAGTSGYGIQAATTSDGSGGTLTINPHYLQTGNVVGGLSTTSVVLASSTTSVTNRSVLVTHFGAVDNNILGGNYTDNITYSCVAN